MDRPYVIRALTGLVVVVAPLVLLLDPRVGFYYDWANHLWFIGYFGEYFRQHLEMPQVLHTTAAAGMPHPVFYGYLLYPSLGLFSSVMGAALALRLGLLLLLVAQYAALRSACCRILGSSPLATLVPASVLWSAYSLTNLYNRCALPEYFAAGLLVTSTALAIAAALENDRRTRRRLTWLAAFAAILMTGSHPPTALIGAPLVVLLAAVLWLLLREVPSRLAGVRSASALGLLLGVLILAPWIQANLLLSSDLGIRSKYRNLDYFPDRSDSLVGRFSPIPYDAASQAGGSLPSTPHLDAPFDLALFLLALAALIPALRNRARSQRPEADRWRDTLGWRLLVLGWLWFLLFGSLTLIKPFSDALPFLAAPIQFAYRLVTHANLGLLLACLGSGLLLQHRLEEDTRFRRNANAVAALAFALAVLALSIKLVHARAVAAPLDSPAFAWRGSRVTLITEGHAAAAADYATPARFVNLAPAEAAALDTFRFPIGTEGAAFGRIGTASVHLAADRRILFNCTAFPWAVLKIDGKPVENAAAARKDFRTAVRLTAGAHVAEWSWAPPPSWSFLRTLSFVALPLGFLLSLASLLALRSVRQPMEQKAAASPTPAAPTQPPDRTVYRIGGWRRMLVWPFARLVSLWGRTLRFDIDESSLQAYAKRDESVAFVLWHNRLFLAAEIARRYRQGRPIYALVSASTDGAWLDAFFSQVGLSTVRGSSSRLGREAAGGLIDVLRRGDDIGITPDGPRGPCYDFKGGAIIVPRRTRTPLLLIGARFHSAWRLGSWDRFYLPRPFSTVHIHGEVVPVNAFAGDRDEAADRLRKRLLEINPD